MRFDVVLTLPEADSVSFEGCLVVVVDVLRATSTIVTAIDNGAKEIIPVLTPEDAIGMKLMGDPNILVCGERKGMRVDGFDLGNSPLEYSPEVVRDKRIVLTTTNGTRAFRLSSSKRPSRVIAGAFLNLSSVCRFIRESRVDTIFLCAGRENRLGLEDVVLAGRCIAELKPGFDRIDLSDSAVTALSLADKFTDPRAMFQHSEHGRYLQSIGLTDDMDYCAEIDIVNIVPEYMVEENCLRRNNET